MKFTQPTPITRREAFKLLDSQTAKAWIVTKFGGNWFVDSRFHTIFNGHANACNWKAFEDAQRETKFRFADKNGGAALILKINDLNQTFICQ